MRARVLSAILAAVAMSCSSDRPVGETTETGSDGFPRVRVNGFAIDVKGKPPAIPLELESAEDQVLPAVTRGTLDGAAVRGEAPRAAGKPARSALQAAAAAKRKKWIVQLDGPVHESDKARIAALGARIGDYLPDFAFVTSMDDDTRARVESLPFVRGVTRYKPAYKISRWLKDESGAVRSDLAKAIRVRVRVDAADGVPPLLSEVLHGRGVVVRVGKDVAQVEVAPSELARLAQLEEVLWIEEAVPARLLNDTSRWVIQSYVSGSTPMFDRGLDGEGQIVGVGDTGLDQDMCFFRDPSGAPVGPTHRKVAGYVALADGWDGVGHGTHVSGTVAGDQAPVTGATTANGMAPKARLFLTDLTPGNSDYVYPPDDLGELYRPPYDAGARIHTNSWGGGANWYETSAWSTDRFMWEHKDMLVLFANGNAGPTDLRVGFPATAKNVISVGATENGALAENVAWFSSYGPAWDGRLKPTLTAPGVAIVSAYSDGNPGTNNCGTTAASGTSMATPTTAGAAALVRQYYVNGYWPSGLANPAQAFLPSAALVKATLVNSAQPMAGLYARGPIPNVAQGWGRINLSNALGFDGDSRFLDVAEVQPGLVTGTSWARQVLATGGSPLKVTLVWTDYPGAQLADVELVNDLDLEVVAPDGSTRFLGNVFSEGVSVSGGSADRLNVEEQVYVPVSVRGPYTVRVTGHNVPFGPQPFAVVISGARPVTSQGFVELDRGRYGAATNVEIKVADRDLNGDAAAADEAFATIRSDADGAGEVVRLVETGPDTGVFLGAIPTGHAPGVDGDGVLAVSEGGGITATYADANDGTGAPATATASAVGDLTPPVISAVSVPALGQGDARISWTTSEPAAATVLFGKTSALGGKASVRWLATSHDVPVGGLEEGTTYFYAVQATDEAGNVTVDDGGGALRTFATLVLPPAVFAHSSRGDVTDFPDVVLFGTAVDPSGVVSLTVNGVLVPVRPADGYFETTVPLALGENRIAVVATDGRGQSGTTTVVVTRNPLPDLAVTAVTAPEVAGIGVPLQVTAEVCNVGPGEVTDDYYQVLWYLYDAVTGEVFPLGAVWERVYSQPAPGTCDGRAYSIVSNRAGQFYVGMQVALYQSEGGGDNNWRDAPNATRFELPDLTVTAVSTPERVGTMVPFTLTTTVANPARGKVSGQLGVSVYLSTDDTITSADRLVATQWISGLDGGASVTTTTSATLPSDIAAGTYRVGAIADVHGLVQESNETNNVLAGALVVVDGPDLEMTSVSGPTTALTGGSVTILDTVSARPTGGGAGSFTVGIYLSPDPIITIADTKLGMRTVSSLAPGASSSGSTVITIPVGWAGGTWYFGAIADAANAVVETDETNNGLAGNAVTIVPPDVFVSAVSGPGQAAQGDSIAVANTVEASAAGAAAPEFYVGIFLSTDPVITANDPLLGYRYVPGLAPGQVSADTTVVRVPTDVVPGVVYYLGAIADDFPVLYYDETFDTNLTFQDNVKETNAANNALAGGTITFSGPDLTVTAVSGPTSASTGDWITLTDSVTNLGGVPAGSFSVGYYLSTDAIITKADTLVGARPVAGGLASGASSSGTKLVSVPWGIPGGTYYFGAIVDYREEAAEGDESNNARAGNTVAVSVKPEPG